MCNLTIVNCNFNYSIKSRRIKKIYLACVLLKQKHCSEITMAMNMRMFNGIILFTYPTVSQTTVYHKVCSPLDLTIAL